jgi:hypothetical protein
MFGKYMFGTVRVWHSTCLAQYSPFSTFISDSSLNASSATVSGLPRVGEFLFLFSHSGSENAETRFLVQQMPLLQRLFSLPAFLARL